MVSNISSYLGDSLILNLVLLGLLLSDLTDGRVKGSEHREQRRRSVDVTCWEVTVQEKVVSCMSDGVTCG